MNDIIISVFSMTSTNIHVFFICYLFLATVNSLVGDQANCQYGKSYGFFTADCSDRKLSKVPSNLKSDIQVLDLSMNNIRELTNNSFTCCTSIKILYLQSNSIYEIESHTFFPLTSLTVLDLKLNVLSELPKNLPTTINRLYLDENPKVFSLENNWPALKISSLTSLEVLTLSSNKLQKFPNFGGNIPNLVELNITNNKFDTLTPEDLAPLCQLQYLYISSETLFASKERLCDCLKLEKWIKKYEIVVYSFLCKNDKTMMDQCNLEITNTTIAVREKCLEELAARKLPYKLVVGSGATALILCLCVLLYIRQRRRNRKKSKTAGGQNSRTPSVKFDNKTLEEKCTNHAFEYKGGQTRPPGSAWETPV